jgi:hypothetical protein
VKTRAALLTAVALVFTGCMGTENPLDTRTVLELVRQVGFTDVHVISSQVSMQELAQALHNVAGQMGGAAEADLIYVGGGPTNLHGPVLVATRFESNAVAQESYETGPGHLVEALSRVPRERLPRSFDLSLLRAERVCNVVISSYNAERDPTLAPRLDQLVLALRRRCGP